MIYGLIERAFYTWATKMSRNGEKIGELASWHEMEVIRIIGELQINGDLDNFWHGDCNQYNTTATQNKTGGREMKYRELSTRKRSDGDIIAVQDKTRPDGWEYYIYDDRVVDEFYGHLDLDRVDVKNLTGKTIYFPVGTVLEFSSFIPTWAFDSVKCLDDADQQITRTQVSYGPEEYDPATGSVTAPKTVVAEY